VKSDIVADVSLVWLAMHLQSFISRLLAAAFCISALAGTAPAVGQLPKSKPVPRLQVIPLPYHQASFQRDGVELTRYHFGRDLNRPFLYPVIGPSGRSLTRMGHPRDPESHSHHNSVWISHNDVDGVTFWGDRGKGKIRHRRIVKFEDGGDRSSLVAENDWLTGDGKVRLNRSRPPLCYRGPLPHPRR